MNIYDAVMNPDSDAGGTILVLDIADSTKMKEEMDEVSWLGNYAKAFDLVVANVPSQGEVVKYLGDGIMVFFPEGQETLAINSAIKIQEALKEASEDKKIRCVLSTGIASGSVKRIPLGEGKFDYLGSVVDRAFRLCSAATPRAIFVDDETVIAANGKLIRSAVGKVLGRTPSDYFGTEGKLQLKGFSKLVKFNEIFWAQDRYGIKSSFVMESGGGDGNKKQKPESTPPVDASLSLSLYGKFQSWKGTVGRVVVDSGEEYFCHKGSVIEGFDLKGGEEVFFVKEDVADKPLNHANHIVPLGVSLTGSVVSVVSKNAFIQCPVLAKNGHENLYAWIGNYDETIRVDDLCTFTLGKGFSKPKNRYTPNATDLDIFDPSTD
jgi:class 3 adenylate cyclase